MPQFKRANNRIYAVKFTAAEKKMIDKEILRQCADHDRKNADEVTALVLWLLHEKFGFGKKRLREFYDAFHTDLDKLVERYYLPEEDKMWLCTHMLKEYGIDISEWNRGRKEFDEKILL
jgi:hypothetical protein